MSFDISKVKRMSLQMLFREGMFCYLHLIRNYLVLNELKNYMFDDHHFCEEFKSCEKSVVGKCFKIEGFLFYENKLCIPACSLRELLVRESHWVV